MTADELAEFVRQSRTDQGLPPKVEDPAVLAKVAAMLLRPTGDGGADG